MRCFIPFFMLYSMSSLAIDTAIVSFDTGYTITNVRSVVNEKEQLVFASTYEGTLLVVTQSGEIKWKNTLSGFMNHDIWAQDIDNDGASEYFAANADGSVYALDHQGHIMWRFAPTEAPMNAVTVITNGKTPVVVAGGYDNSFYYIDVNGKLINEVKSADYSISIPKYKHTSSFDEEGAREPKRNRHAINFLRPINKNDGTQSLVVQTAINSMQTSGSLYLFDYLAQKPSYGQDISATNTPIGDLKVVDIDNDGNDDILMGSTKIKKNGLTIFHPSNKKQSIFTLEKISKKLKEFGYRVAQPEVVNYQSKKSFFLLYGNRLAIFPVDSTIHDVTIYTSHYSFNDMWRIENTNKIILASVQSGGSDIHIIDLDNERWSDEFEALEPTGKMQRVNQNVQTLKKQVNAYRPQYQNKPVYFMSDNRNADPRVIEHLRENYQSPVFLNYGNLGSENYDRSIIKNKAYRNKKDRRQKYNLSQEDVLAKAKKLYKGDHGASFWGGHGNDPHFRSLDTHKKTLDLAKGSKTVMIFPEIAHYNRDFVEMLDDFFYPLAEYSQQKNGIIFLRNKHTFWQSQVYRSGWSRLLSGEFADVFVPGMEETTDKSMELSLSARMGLWAAGSVDAWGTRFSRDNTSFDRLRQRSHQMVPNHALRQFVYHIASGSTYINNFAYDSKYMEVLWEMIAKGIIYVPNIRDIVSFSPVHLSILPPDGHYTDEGNNVKWLNMFDAKVEEDNKLVFSRLNGTWPGAPVTDYDFSRYAAGVKDRRLNFLAPYNNGLVLMTPPQEGPYADKEANRPPLKDSLNPLYADILQEFYTDGRNYYSEDGKHVFAADQYYTVIEQAIKQAATSLPIKVTGAVASVTAQMSSEKLRLTLIDSGYINPSDRPVTLQFNDKLNIESVVDVLTGEKIKVEYKKATLVVPAGLFRFIDINLKPKKGE